MANKKSKEDQEYEDLMKEVEQAQNDKFLLDEDFDEMGYAYGGKIMKRRVGGPMRGKRQERTIQMPNPYSTTLYDTPQKDASYKPTKTVRFGTKKKMGKKKGRRP